ncbi:MAG: hypothetical protein LBF43_03135 [Puniceicoccales bacterium]|nr:hypothetical protein [Puniceicoccales bacterium]
MMVFLVLAFIPGVKKQPAAKPKTQNADDDGRYLEEARKKIEMLKRQRGASELEVQTREPQTKSTVEDLLGETFPSNLATSIDAVRPEIDQPCVCVKSIPRPRLRARIKKSIRLRQWIVGQVVLARKFDARY